MTTATAAIANHLNVAAEAIVEVQEWARVLWVRVKGVGARFVSKKVVKVANMIEAKLYSGFSARHASFGENIDVTFESPTKMFMGVDEGKHIGTYFFDGDSWKKMVGYNKYSAPIRSMSAFLGVEFALNGQKIEPHEVFNA